MKKFKTNEYIDKHALPYHFKYFEKLLEKYDIRGKTILEIGPDQHYIISRLLLENGAAKVLPYSVGSNWCLWQDLPAGIEPVFCDFNLAEIDSSSVDGVIGIALLEHLENLDQTFSKIHNVLKKDGFVFLQGNLLWASASGHHLWAEASKLYSFSGVNPIPPFSHLVLPAGNMGGLLRKYKKIKKRDDIKAIIRSIYEYTPLITSNRQTAETIERVFNTYFEGGCCRSKVSLPETNYRKMANLFYSDDELATAAILADGHKKETPVIWPKERISVIVPCYNVEKYVEQCVDSILAQSYPDIELILVDDESTDGTLEKLIKYESDSRVKIIRHSHNLGLGPARNSGMSAATGKWVFFIDSDDLMASDNVLASLMQDAHIHAADIVISRFETLFEDGKIVPTSKRAYGDLIARELTGLQAFFCAFDFPNKFRFPLHAWGMLINMNTLNKSGLRFPAGMHEDMSAIPFLYLHASRIYYSNVLGIKYQHRDTSLSNNKWDRKYFANAAHLLWLACRKLKDGELLKYFSGISKMFIGHHVNKCKINGLDKEDFPEFLRMFLLHMEICLPAIRKKVVKWLPPLLKQLKMESSEEEYFEIEQALYENPVINKYLSKKTRKEWNARKRARRLVSFIPPAESAKKAPELIANSNEVVLDSSLDIAEIERIIRENFSSLAPGVSRIRLKNLGCYANPYLLVALELLQEKFIWEENPDNGEITLLCHAPVTLEYINEMFGEKKVNEETGADWFYNNQPRNDALLYKRLIKMKNPINRAVMNYARANYAASLGDDRQFMELINETGVLYPEARAFSLTCNYNEARR